ETHHGGCRLEQCTLPLSAGRSRSHPYRYPAPRPVISDAGEATGRPLTTESPSHIRYLSARQLPVRERSGERHKLHNSKCPARPIVGVRNIPVHVARQVIRDRATHPNERV